MKSSLGSSLNLYMSVLEVDGLQQQRSTLDPTAVRKEQEAVIQFRQTPKLDNRISENVLCSDSWYLLQHLDNRVRIWHKQHENRLLSRNWVSWQSNTGSRPCRRHRLMATFSKITRTVSNRFLEHNTECAAFKRPPQAPEQTEHHWGGVEPDIHVEDGRLMNQLHLCDADMRQINSKVISWHFRASLALDLT